MELDLEIHTGERVALIGPNGSGKTTLIRLLATDLSPSSGELRILGADRPSPTLRRRIGYARDHPIHFEALTGTENLRLFAGLRGSAEMNGSFGIDAELDVPVHQYSFGMRRKLLLMEAFAGATELVVLDEPTVGLDPEGIEVLGRAILKRGETGTPVVFATNEVRDIPEWASRVLFLHEGRVVADDTPSGLLERVRGETRITIHLQDSESPIQLRSPRGAAVLPQVIEGLLETGAEIRHIQLHEPDLRDVFQLLTGVHLPEPGP